MKFPAVIHKDRNSDYGVSIPDLPGCVSAGDTIEEVLENAQEAILCHLEGLLDSHEPIPEPTAIEIHRKNKEYSGGTWTIVSIDLEKLSGKARRVNITIPERILSQLDSYAKKKGESRSGMLTAAAMEYISKQD